MPLRSLKGEESAILSEKKLVDSAKLKLKEKGIKNPKIRTLARALLILGKKPKEAKRIFYDLAIQRASTAGVAFAIAEENFEAFMKLTKKKVLVKKPKVREEPKKTKHKLGRAGRVFRR